MSGTMTKEILVDAIQKSKATSISGVWKYLGHASAISGSQSRKIKELVPNCLELIEKNKGVFTAAEKTVQSVAKVVTPKIAKTPKTQAPKKVPGAGGFRQNSGYAALFAEGSKSYTTKEELIAQVSKITGKSEVKVTFDYGVIGSPASKSNGSRAMLDRTTVPGKVKVIPYNEATYMAWKKEKKAKSQA